jgi:hypothetical protein
MKKAKSTRRKHKANGNIQRQDIRRAKPDNGSEGVEKRNKSRGNHYPGIRDDKWDALRSIASDATKASGRYDNEESLSRKHGGNENGVEFLRVGALSSQRQNHSNLHWKDGNHERQRPDGFRSRLGSPGVTSCNNCGRTRGTGCKCGIEYPSRRCSIHNVSLYIIAAPVWTGSGTDALPYKIDRWFNYLRCAVADCNYVRPLKCPGSYRSENRKTSFKRIKNLRQLSITRP